MGLSTVYDAGILSDICFPSRHHEIELPDLFLLLPKIYTVVSRCCPSLAAWDMRTCGVLGTPLWEVILGLLWSKEEEAGWQKGHRRTGSLKQGSHPQTDQIQKQIEMNRDGMSCLKRLEHRMFFNSSCQSMISGCLATRQFTEVYPHNDLQTLGQGSAFALL